MAIRTVVTAAAPTWPPISASPDRVVTSACRTRFSTPTEMISAPLMATRTACSVSEGAGVGGFAPVLIATRAGAFARALFASGAGAFGPLLFASGAGAFGRLLLAAIDRTPLVREVPARLARPGAGRFGLDRRAARPAASPPGPARHPGRRSPREPPGRAARSGRRRRASRRTLRRS